MPEWMKVSGVTILWSLGGAMLGFIGSVIFATVWGFRLVEEHGREPGSDPLVGLTLGWMFFFAPAGVLGGAFVGILCRGAVEIAAFFRNRRRRK